MHSCCVSSAASTLSMQEGVDRSISPHHHHHSRLLYILNDGSLGRMPLARTLYEAPSNITNTTRLSLPPISHLSHPVSSQTAAINQDLAFPSRPTITPRPSYSLAAVEDCCAQCCPLTSQSIEQRSSDTSENRRTIQPFLPQQREPLQPNNEPRANLPTKADYSVADTESMKSPARPTNRKRKHIDHEEADMTTRTSTTCKWASCSATFQTLEDLTPHLFKNHLNSRAIDFSCHWESCEVAVDGSDALVNHLTNHLGERLVHSCRWVNCGQRFVSFDELTNHLSDEHVGAGRSEYSCDWEECDRQGKAFTQRQKVMRHIQTHTGDKPYECNVCKKRFSEANIMTQHMRTHTGEKPYKCPEKGCSREFSISGALTIHRRVHSGEKPFPCKYQGCEKRFAESSNLTKHTRVHTGERPFRCSISPCGKSFSRPDQVSRHLKTHRKEKSGLPPATKQ